LTVATGTENLNHIRKMVR